MSVEFPGKLIIFSAPSGAGKTTLVHHILKIFPQVEFSVSACSRPIRPGEKEGKDYYFLSVDEFKKKIENNEFVEWQEVYKDNYYGTLKKEVERIWAKNHVVIFDVDVVGGLNLKETYGKNALSVFVKAPSLKHLEDRLKRRETETAESIARRMAKASKEMNYAEKFDAIVLNDDIQKAFDESQRLVTGFILSS
jgi:guanylate kinase